MKLHALTFPDDPHEWGNWLDDLITSHNLVSTIADLKAITRKSINQPKILSEVLGEDDLRKLLSLGFSELDPEKCRRLVAQPDLLFEVEEQILKEPSSFWLAKMASGHNAPSFEKIIKQTPRSPSKTTPTAGNTPTSTTRRSMLTWGTIVAVAATAIFAMWLQNPPAKNGWGFNSPDAFVAQGSEEKMLEHLDSLAHKWYKKVPDTREGLATRLKQYQRGCQSLLDALDDSLPELSDSSRKAVKKACELCKSQIVHHLKSLENGEKLEDVLLAANSSIDDLKDGIRDAG